MLAFEPSRHQNPLKILKRIGSHDDNLELILELAHKLNPMRLIHKPQLNQPKKFRVELIDRQAQIHLKIELKLQNLNHQHQLPRIFASLDLLAEVQLSLNRDRLQH